jgi:hypothetical protein
MLLLLFSYKYFVGLLKDIDVTMELDIILVEMILDMCSKNASLKGLIKMTGVPNYLLKIHLFYLVEYGMISYTGLKHGFTLTQESSRLLSVIAETKYTVYLNDDEYISTIILE